MSEQNRDSSSGPLSLPEAPNLEWLRKQAKRRLAELHAAHPDAKLADAQLDVARQHGFPSWRALKAHIDALTADGKLFEAARTGDVETLTALLDANPEKLHARKEPYEWSLLHIAASGGHLATVDLLLKRGLDVNTLEKGDRTYAMHWAAAAGHLEVVRRLADAGGDVVGHGDDHELDVIGWATCWEGCDDDAHRAVADLLVSRGARHTIYSAIAMNLGDELRRIVADDPKQLMRRMSRNEDHQFPLHFAVRMNRPDMVGLLLDLGADPLAVDQSGQSPAAYATTVGADRRVMEVIRTMMLAELDSAVRGRRSPDLRAMDLVAMLALGDWETAERILRDIPGFIASGGSASGVLPIMSKRGDGAAVQWLLGHGADANTRWKHWGAEVTPLHLAILGNHADVVRMLLASGADPAIRDSEHDGTALDWAGFFRRPEIIEILGGTQ